MDAMIKCAKCYGVDCRNFYINEELSATIQAKDGGGYSLNYIHPVLYEASRNENYTEQSIFCFAIKQYGNYFKGLPTLRATGGDVGGGSEGLIVIKNQL